MRKKIELDLNELKESVKKSESYADVINLLGLSNKSGNDYRKIKKMIKENNIDISHFKFQGHSKNIGKIKTPTEDYLNNKVKITSHKLRKRLIAENYFKYECCCCKRSVWMGYPIPLELHHKDGNKNNNTLSNLELRCPNCHYFTETYKSKNKK